MPAVQLFKFSTSGPEDSSPLRQLEALGFPAASVVALAGKTEGNGCVNDFSRTLAAHVWDQLLPPTAVSVFSGGTEGVLSPHVTFLVESKSETGLVAASGRTRLFEPQEVGTEVQAVDVSKTVEELIGSLGVGKEQVVLVLVKCPLLTSTKMATIRSKGLTPVTTDTYESMAKSRYTTAVGIAAALDELPKASIAKAVEKEDTWSARASCSSGAELDDCHVLVIASKDVPDPKLKAVHSYMDDAIDAKAIMELLEKVKKDSGKVEQVFVKAEADPSGLVRGKRHTMLTDSDLHSTRHARAAVGGLVAGLTGDPCVYVSGGAEGQGPPGGGSLCIVYSV